MNATYDTEQEKLLAQAGLDLFLGGFVHDAVHRSKLESRYPGVAPNLSTIAEEVSPRNTGVFSDSSESQIIVVIGGPIKKVNNVAPIQHRYGPGTWLSYRIEAAVKLYEKIANSWSAKEERPHCYLVPTGGDPRKVGIMEAEVTRNTLIEAGISPHQIVMDCVYVRHLYVFYPKYFY